MQLDGPLKCEWRGLRFPASDVGEAAVEAVEHAEPRISEFTVTA